MMPLPTLFIDRDGTLVEEPADEQVDALDKIRFMPGVFAALSALQRRRLPPGHGHQPGRPGHGRISRAPTSSVARISSCARFASQGIRFDAICICPHRAADGCDCRKPQTGLLRDWLGAHAFDPARSAVIGDRDTDLQLAANLGVRGLRVRHPRRRRRALARRGARAARAPRPGRAPHARDGDHGRGRAR